MGEGGPENVSHPSQETGCEGTVGSSHLPLELGFSSLGLESGECICWSGICLYHCNELLLDI